MRKHIATAALALAAVLLTGCEGLKTAAEIYGGEKGLGVIEWATEKAGKVEDATLGNAVKALPPYCNLTPAARAKLRERIAARPEAEGALIGIWCPKDPPLTLGAPAGGKPNG